MRFEMPELKENILKVSREKSPLAHRERLKWLRIIASKTENIPRIQIIKNQGIQNSECNYFLC